MKVKHLLLGIAIVALMAACGKKAQPTETPTETPVATETATATPAETPAEQAAPAEKPAATPAKETKTTKAPKAKKEAKKETAKVDPCEAKVKAFEGFVDQINAAKKNKATGAKALKAYADLVKQAPAEEAKVKECVGKPEYKTRLNNAIMSEKRARS
ncbi:MAG: hypothetical protein LKE30_07855 [Bacteroidales bacterium]|jgi:hypothetical protein|nr:hypothetical protein [Bacteroidales bacterium]